MCFGGVPEQKIGPYEKKLVELSDQKMTDYESIYQPLEQDMITESQKFDQPWYRNEQANIAASATRQPTAPIQANVGAGLKQALVNSQLTNKFSGGFAAGGGELLARQQGTGFKLGLAQSGRQQSNTSSGLYGSLAANEFGQNVAISNAEQSVRDANYGALGTAVGTAGGYMMASQSGGAGGVGATAKTSPFTQATRNHETWTVNSHAPRFGMPT